MPHLTLSLLGPLQVVIDGQAVSSFAYNKARALLAYLAVEAGRSQQRDTIVGLLWPETPDAAARTSLRQVLASLRDTIGPGDSAAPFLVTTRDTLQFNPASDYTLDVTRFVSLLETCAKHRHRHISRCPACAVRLEEAVALYRGDFLAQLSSVDSVLFEEWLVVKREALHQQAVEALTHLAHYHERWGDSTRARQLLLRLIEVEPWDETAYAHLMRLLARAGQRSAALVQYETCRRILAEQFGVEPSPATQKLIAQIRAGLPLEEVPSSRSTELPSITTKLIGRDVELTELSDLLSDPAQRLLTISGPGGMGKTRLALAALTATAPIFDDGAVFVPLAALISADLLPATILATLGLPLEQQVSPEQQLIDHLRSRELLLVLDNFEHLLAHVELIKRIIQQAPQITLLITSRERLALQAERVFELEGLDYPAGDGTTDLERYQAVQLFSERAQRLQRKFQLTLENTAAVGRICRLVEGLPLAIELAASTINVQSCAAIADGIAGDLRALATRLRDVPDRHRSMWAAFEHSWRLLRDDEQLAFSHLSVFRGGFQVEAAQPVAGASAAMLATLIDKSLVQREVTGRYALHELLRQYGQEKLGEAGGLEQAHERHLAWFLQLAGEAEPQLVGKEQASWLKQLEIENDNLRAALQWSLDNRRVESAARLGAALQRFWYLRGHLTEGRQWLERVLMHGPVLALAARADIVDGACRLARAQADLSHAVAFAQQAVALQRELGNKSGIAAALNSLSLIVRDQGDLEQASLWLEESLTLWRESGDQRGISNGLNNLGIIARRRGHYQRAKLFFEESLVISRRLGDQHAVAQALSNLGNVARHQADLAQAQTFYEQGLSLYREIGNVAGIANALNSLGIVARLQGAYPQAVALHEDSLNLRRKIGDRRGIASALNNLGLAWLEQRDLVRATSALIESLALAREQGDKSGMISNVEALAEVAIIRGQFLYAARSLGAAEAWRETLGSPLSPDERSQLDPYLNLAQAQLDAGAFAQAWESGRKLTLEEAIACALEEIDQH
ncbi:Putative HTH-type transcriptional regulator [Thermoflexales bacterium]|nr:Putative HTH-type transcriptional regulator [Thermoflexales bacterium]